jgi:hypothetical protein
MFVWNSRTLVQKNSKFFLKGGTPLSEMSTCGIKEYTKIIQKYGEQDSPKHYGFRVHIIQNYFVNY